MNVSAFLFCLMVAANWLLPVATLSSSSSFVHRRPLLDSRNRFLRPQPQRQTISRRDASASYWFQLGDTVKVVADDVEKAGTNLRDRVGTVIETWEKCDVDPTCCCAEQVDVNMAVRVKFDDKDDNASSEEDTSFTYYFAEEELDKADK